MLKFHLFAANREAVEPLSHARNSDFVYSLTMRLSRLDGRAGTVNFQPHNRLWHGAGAQQVFKLRSVWPCP